MAQPIQVTYNLLANTTTSILNAAASGTAVFTGLLATSVVGPNQQRLLLTVTGNESSNTFTFKGTNQAGFAISETIAGPNNSTAASVLDYVTLTSVTSKSTTAGTTSIGLWSTGSTMWFYMNQNAAPVNIEASGVVTSSSTAVTWGVQYTYDDPNGFPLAFNQANATTPQPSPFNHPTLNAVAGTTSLDGPINDPVMAVRGIITNGTGVVKFTFIEAGAASP